MKIKDNIFSILFVFVFTSCVHKEQVETLYSQQMVERRALKTFLSNKSEQRLSTAKWDYVPGLVANSVLKAWQQYPEKIEYYQTVKAYADFCLQGADTLFVEKNNIDDLAAGKIFFALYQHELEQGNTADAMRYKNCADFLRNKLKYDHERIPTSKPGSGGFIHKAIYKNQMWLDGLYMGAAFYAQWQHYFGEELGEKDNFESWTDITNQFKIIHHFTFDNVKELNYHGWSAEPNNPNSFWANQKDPYIGCSPEFWGRGMGWYFAALVDVLEFIPVTHQGYAELVQITHDVAQGLVKYQDENTGC